MCGTMTHYDVARERSRKKLLTRLSFAEYSVKSVNSRSIRSTRSSKSSRSSSAIMAEAAANAAALKTRLQYLDEENRYKAELERKRAEFEKFQTLKELHIAQSKIKAVCDLGTMEDNSSDLLEELEPETPQREYVQRYVDSIPSVPDPPATVPTPTCVTDSLVRSSDSPHVQPFYLPQPHVQPEVRVEPGDNAQHPPTTSVPACATDSQMQTSKSPHVQLEVKLESGVPDVPVTASTDACAKDSKSTNVKVEVNGQSGDNSGSQPADTNQIQLFKLLADQMNLGRLPAPEPNIFSGDPLQHPMWNAASEILIAKKSVPPEERIYYLKKYLSSEAKEAIEGYFLISSAGAYEEAKQLIQKRYGDNFVIGNAFRRRLEDWKKIGNKDGAALRKYSDFLHQCEAAMSSNDSLKILNDVHENKRMVSKLPDWLIHRWGRKVADYKAAHERFPPLSEFVKFVSQESEIACEPAFRDLTRKEGNKTSSVRTLSTESKEMKPCLSCERVGHVLDDCRKFRQLSIEQRKEFIKEKKLCFACLRSGHRAKECRARLTCKTCKKMHATCLHGDTKPGKDPKSMENTPTVTVSHASRSSKANNCRQCSMIVPVWLSHVSSPDERLVYALLYTQSDTSFILQETCDKMGLHGTNVKLMLSTMTAENTVIDSNKMRGLQVRGYDSDLKISLPVVFRRDVMPANRRHIPTPETALKWPHLNKIADKLRPIEDFEVGLLLGYNCPRALVPREVIPCMGNGPYGQRTDLGWGIVGLIDPNKVDTDDDSIGVSHRILTYEVPHQLSVERSVAEVQISLKTSIKEVINPQQVARMMEVDFNEHPLDEKIISQDDKKFMEIMQEGIHQREDLHYEMPLPLRGSQPVHLPNNKIHALHRLRQTKKRLMRDAQYRKHYEDFMQNIIECGFATFVS